MLSQPLPQFLLLGQRDTEDDVGFPKVALPLMASWLATVESVYQKTHVILCATKRPFWVIALGLMGEIGGAAEMARSGDQCVSRLSVALSRLELGFLV